ncbi:metallophosphoesterase family protein [Methanococcoides sp. FTZ1]|uniref:metallophosphoesterase family protein n=1 Tax=Methanococcoides sp. FTZ1 TaxID=3439061 RepID=UPI003F8665EB
MRILALADVHGDHSHIESLLEMAGNIDLVVISGDLTQFGPASEAETVLSMFDVPVLAVAGNCDPKDVNDVIDSSDAVNLHKSVEKIEGVTFIGMGGSSPTPFCTPFELEEDEIEAALEPLFAEAEGTVVLVSHAPPKGLLDDVGGNNVGSTAVAKFIDRARLVICAHIHEARGFARSGDTFLVNPGMAAQGYGALIELEPDNVSVVFLEA